MFTKEEIEEFARNHFASDIGICGFVAGATWANNENAAEIDRLKEENERLKVENERLRKEYAQAGDKIADLEDRIFNLKIKFETYTI